MTKYITDHIETAGDKYSDKEHSDEENYSEE